MHSAIGVSSESFAFTANPHALAFAQYNSLECSKIDPSPRDGSSFWSTSEFGAAQLSSFQKISDSPKTPDLSKKLNKIEKNLDFLAEGEVDLIQVVCTTAQFGYIIEYLPYSTFTRPQ